MLNTFIPSQVLLLALTVLVKKPDPFELVKDILASSAGNGAFSGLVAMLSLTSGLALLAFIITAVKIAIHASEEKYVEAKKERLKTIAYAYIGIMLIEILISFAGYLANKNTDKSNFSINDMSYITTLSQEYFI